MDKALEKLPENIYKAVSAIIKYINETDKAERDDIK